MADFDNNIQPESKTLLRDILRLMAQSPQLEDVAANILLESCARTKATAGFFLLFDEPRVEVLYGIESEQLPHDGWLATSIAHLNRDVHVTTDLPQSLAPAFSGWLVVPLEIYDDTVGMFSLLFQHEIQLDDSDAELLMTLMDVLTIVTHNAKSEARQTRLNENQNEFVRIVSHDLRSPLASVKGFASMLESQMVGDLNEKQVHFISKILSGVDQMTSLVDNIQDAGRYDPENGFYQMERGPVDLIDMVQNIVKTHIVPAEKQELTLKVNTTDDIPIVNVDSNMMERSVSNLVDNAIKYTPNGGTIEVGVRREGHSIIIFVADNGFGISEENLQSLFQRHFRIKRKEHTKVKGIGLGLFIVRSVARQHGGDAFVESVEGEGSTFGIRIPLAGENLLSAGGSAED